MNTYLEISISADEHQRESLMPTMIEFGCEAFQESDSSLLCYINKNRWDNTKQNQLLTYLKQILRTITVNSIISVKEIEEENWNAQWEKTVQPIEIGSRVVIKPSWAFYDNPDGKILIQIDPKMSFGTGYHESTRLIIALIEKYIQPATTVLDIGTGTGILAITAVKLGAQSAIGIDNDEWAIDNAKENIQANNVASQISISNTSIQKLPLHSFDLICANLTLNTIIEMLEQFARLLRKDGTLLLSGLLMSDEQEIISKLQGFQFKPIDRLIENEWLTLAAKKAE
ncbi:MAG TPA: 50S ribosomal protein L11 methyltransferase [Bacteroidota bacterium]|nr:50S ribosomal protein L11 methyltransferase [Bacteroidota bacterium]